jgi:hypothetical protein
MVVRASACRIAYCMSRSGTPLIRPAVQKVRRSVCALTGLVTRAARTTRGLQAAGRSTAEGGSPGGDQDRPAYSAVGGGLDRAQHRDGQRNLAGLVPLPITRSSSYPPL